MAEIIFPDDFIGKINEFAKKVVEASERERTIASGNGGYVMSHGERVTEVRDWEITMKGGSMAGLSHERMRFNTMTERRLWTRLGKISKHDKLLDFAIVAKENGQDDLAIAAGARYKMLTGEGIDWGTSSNYSQPRAKESGRLLRRIDCD